MDYASDDGKNYISHWMGKNLSTREAMNTAALLKILSNKQKWEQPEYKTLSGDNNKPLGEIRLPGDQKIPIRLIGFFDEGKKQFVILIVCRHKDNVYTPRDCLSTAIARYKDLTIRGRGTTQEHFNDNDEETGEE